MSIEPGRGLAFELSGVQIQAPSDVITPAIAEALTSGSYEVEEARIVSLSLKPHDRVLEIGSGLGFVTTLIARDERVASLVAFEADPRLAKRAASTLALNGCTGAEVINAVLAPEASTDDTAEFYQRPDFWMSSMFETDVPYEKVVAVPVMPLNTLLRERAITCIVCDIEGGEVELLKGADLGCVDRVVVELHYHITGLSGAANLFDTMRRKGFAYDPRCSEGTVVLFRQLDHCKTAAPTAQSERPAYARLAGFDAFRCSAKRLRANAIRRLRRRC